MAGSALMTFTCMGQPLTMGRAPSVTLHPASVLPEGWNVLAGIPANVSDHAKAGHSQP